MNTILLIKKRRDKKYILECGNICYYQHINSTFYKGINNYYLPERSNAIN